MGRWSVLIVLSAAQFLMVLDQSVMNVSISQLVADFDTSVTAIQGVITLYSLVMAALMITGGKLGDLWGRSSGAGLSRPLRSTRDRRAAGARRSASATAPRARGRRSRWR